MTSSMVESFTLNLTAFQNVSFVLADPKYFIANGNPLVVPKLKIEMFANFGFRPVYIKATKVRKLNRKAAPCEELEIHGTTIQVSQFVNVLMLMKSGN